MKAKRIKTEIRKIIDNLVGKVSGVDKKRNPFEPNRVLYIVLLLSSLLIIVCSAFIPQQCIIFTIVSGIGCGGFSSTIIAWLIDEANAKMAFQKARNNRQILFKKLSDCFDHGLQILIFNVETYVKDTKARKWYEWIDVAHEVIKTSPSFAKDYLVSLRVFIGNVSESMYDIQSQSALMLEYGIIDKTDIEALKVIITICELVEKNYQSEKDENKLIENITMYCGLLKGLLGYSHAMKDINEMTVEPLLHKTTVEKEIMQSAQSVPGE